MGAWRARSKVDAGTEASPVHRVGTQGAGRRRQCARATNGAVAVEQCVLLTNANRSARQRRGVRGLSLTECERPADIGAGVRSRRLRYGHLSKHCRESALSSTLHMAERSQALESLTAEERIALMGRLWDSLDPVAAAPLSPALAIELNAREAEADADPDAGIPWAALRDELRARIR